MLKCTSLENDGCYLSVGHMNPAEQLHLVVSHFCVNLGQVSSLSARRCLFSNWTCLRRDAVELSRSECGRSQDRYQLWVRAGSFRYSSCQLDGETTRVASDFTSFATCSEAVHTREWRGRYVDRWNRCLHAVLAFDSSASAQRTAWSFFLSVVSVVSFFSTSSMPIGGNEEISRVLLQFLKFYGHEFDYKTTGIGVSGYGAYFPLRSPSQTLVVLSPFKYQADLGVINVASELYRFPDVQCAFAEDTTRSFVRSRATWTATRDASSFLASYSMGYGWSAQIFFFRREETFCAGIKLNTVGSVMTRSIRLRFVFIIFNMLYNLCT